MVCVARDFSLVMSSMPVDVAVCRVIDNQSVVVQVANTKVILAVQTADKIDPVDMARARQISVFQPVPAQLELGKYNPQTRLFENSVLRNVQWPIPPPRQRTRWF